MRSTLLSLFAIAGLIYVTLCAYLYFMQRSMMYFPTPPSANVAAERLVVGTEGARLVVWRLQPGLPDAILYFGGNAEDVSLNVPEFSEWFSSCTVYLVHYRGYGGSSGSPTEPALYRDAEAVFDSVRNDHRRIAVIGRSLGSGVATHLATVRDVDRLVLVTPAASFTRLAAELYPIFPAGLLLRDRYDSLARADHIESPVLVLVAEHDEIIPPDHSRSLAEAIDPRLVTLQVVENTGHNSIGSSPEYGRALASFLCERST